MPGVRLAETITREHPGIQVLLMSGTSSQKEGTVPEEVLHKPFSREALTQRVECALAKTLH